MQRKKLFLKERSIQMEKPPSASIAMSSTSEEEADNLIRSTKKVKTNGQGSGGDRDKMKKRMAISKKDANLLTKIK